MTLEIRNPADDVLDGPIPRIHAYVADITQLPADWQVDAIANAANSQLAGGGGVDGAIHRAAGPRMLDACHALGGCATGLAKQTPAFDLETIGVKHVFHAVAPVWVDGQSGDVDSVPLASVLEDNLLASCYVQIMQLCERYQVKHVAIPALGTGVYGFPRKRAARIAFGHVHGHLQHASFPQQVTFVFFSQDDLNVFKHEVQTRRDWMTRRRQ